MKKLLLLLCFFVFTSGWCQVTFTSAYTEYWPDIFGSHVTEVDRSISISEKEISIVTDTEEGKLIENLLVYTIDENKSNLVFHCLSRIGERPVTVIVPLKKAGIIDLFRISPKTGEEEQVRYYLSGH